MNRLTEPDELVQVAPSADLGVSALLQQGSDELLEHARLPVGRDLEHPEMARFESPGMEEMELLGVRVEMPANAPIVLLRERGSGGRTVPIFIGAAEATAIALALDGVAVPRPMTHDLLRDVLDDLSVTVERVVVTEIHDKTFFAELHLLRDGELHVVSSRPSDAIALAVRTDTPIYADDVVLEEAGFRDGDEPEDSDSGEEVVEEFKEFLDTIRPEDFED